MASLQSEILSQFDALKEQERAKNISPYDPRGAQLARLQDLQAKFLRADTIRATPYEEFNHLTLVSVTDRDRKAFNNYVPARSDNPDEAWHANTVRPVTRNKIISIAAHLTSSLLFPQVYAQNENDEEDRDAGLVMRDLNLWSAQQSKYAFEFVRATVKALVDPAMIMYEGYADVRRTIKEMQDNGSYTIKEIQDEAFSGFLNLLIPVEELFIGNVYESDIQKQPFLFWRRVIDHEEAIQKYGHLEDFKKYVISGVKVFYVQDQRGFYQMYDQNLASNLDEEVIYYDRYQDLELRLVNGVLLDNPDRPLSRADKRYPMAKTGYEIIGGTDFFYYKSLAAKLASDQEVVDTLYNIIIDGSFLQVMPPGVVVGDEEVGGAVIIPGAVTTLAEGSSFQTLQTNNNLQAGLNVLAKVEASLSESSSDPLMSGITPEGTPATAFQIQRQEQNARTILGLFGKMIVRWVEDFGQLRLASILQHLTVAQAAEVTGDSTRLKFHKFLLPPEKDGAGKSKQIRFDMNMPELQVDALRESFKIMQEEDTNSSTISVVNPDLFRRNKYLFKVQADFMPTQSEALKKALNLEAYDRAIQNPLLDQEKVTAEFLLESYRPGEADKFMRKSTQPNLAIAPGNSNLTSQILNKTQAGAMA